MPSTGTSEDGCRLRPSPKCLEISIPIGQLSRDSNRARQPQPAGRRVAPGARGAEAPSSPQDEMNPRLYRRWQLTAQPEKIGLRVGGRGNYGTGSEATGSLTTRGRAAPTPGLRLRGGRSQLGQVQG